MLAHVVRELLHLHTTDERRPATRTVERQHEGVSGHRNPHARPVTLAQVNARPLPIRLRDGVARLFSPYL